MMDPIPTALFPLGVASLLAGWPIMAYYFWTRHNLQEVAPTWRIVSIVCLTSWLVAFLLYREIAEIAALPPIPIVIGKFGPHVWDARILREQQVYFTLHIFTATPLVCLAAYGALRIWRRFRPFFEDDEPASSRLFS